MVTTMRGHETNREQPLGLRWLPFVNRVVFLRSLEVLLGVSGELVSAVPATEIVFGAVVTVGGRLLFADS